MSPNQPRADNQHRSVRVEDALWEDARKACEELGTTRAAVMQEALRQIVREAERMRKP